jgi:hypothetical protein
MRGKSEIARVDRTIPTGRAERIISRPKAQYAFKLSTDIPEYIKRPGFTCYWERHSIKGKPDEALDHALSLGWKPVPKERWTGNEYDILKRNPLSDKFVLAGDLILLEIENELLENIRTAQCNAALDAIEHSEAYNYKNNKRNYIGYID